MSQVNANSIYDASGGSNAVLYGVAAPANSMGFRNRIINGDMRIDQRNAGASVTMSAAVVYTVDRWWSFEDTDGTMTAQQSSTAPTGFTNSLLCTTTSADASLGATQRVVISQAIEGYNIADLGWGTASAQAVTLSFWVRSSLTGTFGGAVKNSTTRSYPFTYTISAANTWEQKTVTIAGDTSGTWLTTNGVGMNVNFGLGAGSTYSGTAGAWANSDFNSATGATSVVGTNGATFYITGVQLEAGVASPFERVDYSTQLMRCQRYYVELGPQLGTNAYRAIGFGSTYTTTQGTYVIQVPVPMRIVPSLSQAGTMYLQNLGSTSVSSFAGPYTMGGTIIEGDFTMAGAIASNAIGILRWNNVAGTKSFAYSAEL